MLDLFASRRKCPWEEQERFATIGSHVLDDTEILLVKPQTYMNRSGEVVGRILDESDVPTESVIVVHDDMDLPFETMKLKKGGGWGWTQRNRIHPVGTRVRSFFARQDGDWPTGGW